MGDGLLEASHAVICEDVEVDAVAILLAEIVESGGLENMGEVVVAAVGWLILGDVKELKKGLTDGKGHHGLETHRPHV